MLVAMFMAVVVRVVAAVRFEDVPALLGQDHGDVPMTIKPLRSDESLLAQMSQVAQPRIGRAIVVVAEVARRDDAKRADGREREALRAPQRVLAVAGIVDDLPARSTRQVEIAHEHVARVDALASIA